MLSIDTTGPMKEDLSKAVGHIPSGLFIITAGEDAYLGSWVQQVSFSPLLISMAVKSGRPAFDAITNGQTFVINIIGEHDKSFLKLFWKGYDPNNNPLQTLPLHITKNGGVILKQAKSAIECKKVEMISPGDHQLVIAQVINTYINNEESKPLVHLRKSGMDY